MALFSYCIFADESVSDIVVAVETFPTFKKAKPDDKVNCMVCSCVLRLVQGGLASCVVLLLIITTSDVIDIILNFTAVNFISGFDDVAFELAKRGKYGPKLEAEANRIEELPAPECIVRKYPHIRYRFTIIPIALILVTLLGLVVHRQDSVDIWLTKRLRVQFKDASFFEGYSGCYKIIEHGNTFRIIEKHAVYESFEKNPTSAKFGYCPRERKWYLYEGDLLSPCDIPLENQLASSAKTYSFDISTVFEETWYSSSGTPLELYFFDNEDSLDDPQCGSFLGDGKCNDIFNIPAYEYDQGDCCAASCVGQDCGIETMKKVFNTTITSGSGYPSCEDPRMKPITIHIDNVYPPETTGLMPVGIVMEIPPTPPLLMLDCDDKNILMVSIVESMSNQSETVMVRDGSKCEMVVTNVTSGNLEILFVNYTIYHGNANSVRNNPIVMLRGNSFENAATQFQRIRNCFFTELDAFIDNSKIYTGTDPSNKALNWLMEDSLGYSNCLNNGFLERYALATINYAAPIVDPSETSSDVEASGLWITTERQCAWENVVCRDGRVSELQLGGSNGFRLSGTIATEISLLENLVALDISNNDLYGSIPPQIGDLQNLGILDLENGNLTGSLPTEIGELTELYFFVLSSNEINGSIPTEIGKMKSSYAISFAGNALTGPIPSEIGEIKNLAYLHLGDNLLTSTIPSTIGALENLVTMFVEFNLLTGSIPMEVLQLPKEYNVYGNKLSNLLPVDGFLVCSSDDSELYCDCARDCAFYPERCTCEEAKACCTTLLEPLIECDVCPSGELENSDFVTKTGYTCGDLAAYAKTDIFSTGTEEQCKEAQIFHESFGCICSGVQEDASAANSADKNVIET